MPITRHKTTYISLYYLVQDVKLSTKITSIQKARKKTLLRREKAVRISQYDIDVTIVRELKIIIINMLKPLMGKVENIQYQIGISDKRWKLKNTPMK